MEPEKESIEEESKHSIDRRSILKAIGATGVMGAVTTSTVAAAEVEDEFDPIDATIDDVYSAIASRSITAAEVTQTYLDRIDAYDEALNTVITLNENAVDRAEELDETLEESGPVGPLHGVPITVKDIYDTGDLPTTAASLSLEGAQPDDDSYFVKQLREAGAVVLAKTNTHEYARGGRTLSSLGGQTRNPYDLDRIPSGSSGGSAASVAANLSVFGTASDTGGSTRGPAAFTNLVGIRPTVGLSSRDGIVPIANTYDTAGVVTRTVAGTALVLDLTAGYNSDDPITARSIGNIPTSKSTHKGSSYTDYLQKNGLEGTRIGVYRDFFGTEFDQLADDGELSDDAEEDAAQVTAVMDSAIEQMEVLGATIVDPISIGPIEEIRELYDDGYYIQAEVKESLNAYFDSHDTPIGSVEELYESKLYACDIAGSIEAAFEAPADGFEEEFRENVGRRSALREMIVETMAEEELDAIVYPSEAQPPARIDEEAVGVRRRLSPNADMPAIAVPAGFTERNHLPVGLELLGRQWSEPLLLKLAYGFEQGTDLQEPPEGFGPLPNDPPEVSEEYEVSVAIDGCD